jgi:hypothetical protein
VWQLRCTAYRSACAGVMRSDSELAKLPVVYSKGQKARCGNRLRCTVEKPVVLSSVGCGSKGC